MFLVRGLVRGFVNSAQQRNGKSRMWIQKMLRIRDIYQRRLTRTVLFCSKSRINVI